MKISTYYAYDRSGDTIFAVDLPVATYTPNSIGNIVGDLADACMKQKHLDMTCRWAWAKEIPGLVQLRVRIDKNALQQGMLHGLHDAARLHIREESAGGGEGKP